IALVAIALRMLLPDQRIRSDGIQRIEVVRPQRPQLEQLARQRGLKIERHRVIRLAGRFAGQGPMCDCGDGRERGAEIAERAEKKRTLRYASGEPRFGRLSWCKPARTLSALRFSAVSARDPSPRLLLPPAAAVGNYLRRRERWRKCFSNASRVSRLTWCSIPS